MRKSQIFVLYFFFFLIFFFYPTIQSIQSIQSLLKNVIYTYIYKRKIFKFLNIKKKETKLFLKDFDQKSNFIEIFQYCCLFVIILFHTTTLFKSNKNILDHII